MFNSVMRCMHYIVVYNLTKVYTNDTMCYSKCHDAYILSLKKLLVLTNETIMTINGRDTLKHVDIYLNPSQIVYMTLNTINCVQR